MATHGNDNSHGNSHGNNGSRMQDVNVPLILTIGVISSLLLIVSVIGMQAWYHFEAYNERQRKVFTAENRELVELQTSQRQRINSYRWVDETRQQAAIPVNEAMTIYVQRHQEQADPQDQPRADAGY